MNSADEYEPTDDWRVGDRAHISGDPECEYLSKRDIVRVTRVGANGQPKTIDYCLVDDGFKPLRLIRPGELVEAGTKWAYILADCSLGGVETAKTAFRNRNYNTPTVLISKPKPVEPVEASDDEKLKRITELVAELGVVADKMRGIADGIWRVIDGE